MAHLCKICFYVKFYRRTEIIIIFAIIVQSIKINIYYYDIMKYN